jgi:acetoacetyl-CoA synthetase
VPEAATVPRVVWTPSDRARAGANLTRFLRRLREERHLDFADYNEVWRWSVERLDEFWAAVWDFYDLPPHVGPALAISEMPGAVWFPGAQINYAEQLLNRARHADPAVLYLDETREPRAITHQELRGQVGALAAALSDIGVQPGDRVAGYLPNVPEAVIAMLATTSLGAVWSVCAPDFGAQSVIDRFAQLEPKVLIGVDGYRFAGRTHDRRATLAELQAALTSLADSIIVRSLFPDSAQGTGFDQLVREPREPQFASVPFEHPLWILFSSGTTGIPKGLVHSHGGIVVEHLKSLGLGLDLTPNDRFFFYSATSWMAWNYLVGGLLHGATAVLYDGSPGHPRQGELWSIADATKATVMGTGSAYVSACQKTGVTLTSPPAGLRTIIPTGSPLPPSGWDWLLEQLSPTTRIDSICGGTDVCTAYFGGNPLLPVYTGEISARCLGVKAESWSPVGVPQTDAVGEFVVTAPMPSMPLRLWNDQTGDRYRDAYFDRFPGVWRQGDWITVSSRGTVTVSGRSDATLNRHGIRIGSAEIYGAVEDLPEVADSLVVGLERADGDYEMLLFVVTTPGHQLDRRLRTTIQRQIRTRLSPRHVPDQIVEAPAVPRTLTGKKLELPVKRLLQGHASQDAVALGAVSDPAALEWFARYGARAAGASPA